MHTRSHAVNAAFSKTPRKKLHTEIKRAKDLSDTDAAKMIQGMFRAHNARKMMRRIVRETWMSVMDYESGKPYYVNKVTKEVSWDKPKLLGKKGT